MLRCLLGFLFAASAACAQVCNVSATIAQIQGVGPSSPLDGTTVTTRGVVTAHKSNGFFLQMPSPGDADPETSDGLFVFTSSAPPSSAAIGNDVCVNGPVLEFVSSSDPFSPPLTEINRPAAVILLGTAALPEPVLLTAAETLANDLNNLEKYEGMRVRIESLVVVAPTGGTVNEANATATSNGIFHGVLAGVPRPFREAGIRLPDPLPAGAPCCVPRFDGNPERIRVSSNAQPGAARLDVAAGMTVSNLTGVLDYGARAYTLLPDAAAAPTVAGSPSARPLPAPAESEIVIASFNMERFFDTVNDPSTSDAVLTPAAFETRLNKASLLIRGVLRSPAILAVIEVENLETLQALADKLNNDAAASGESRWYTAQLAPGNDIGGINIGFLIRAEAVVDLNVAQYGKDDTFLNPATGRTEILNDRPPLLLEATLTAPDPLKVTVIANHLRSLTDIDSPTSGARIRAKRAAQAEFLARLIQERQAADPAANIVVLGDFNAFEVNDGYVDVLGTIAGAPAPADSVIVASPDLVDPDLTSLTTTLAPEDRYSYVYDGSAQALDHILVSRALLPRITRFTAARVNADFPESLRGDPTRPERLSDHDPLAVYITTGSSAPVR